MPDDSAKPRIAMGADHAGYHVKENIRKYLEQAGYTRRTRRRFGREG